MSRQAISPHPKGGRLPSGLLSRENLDQLTPRGQADMSQAATLAGAAPGHAPDWHSINWKKVWRTVRRLQARIAVIRGILSTCNALCQGGLLTLPDVPPSVGYPSGPHRQRRGPKPGGQRNLDLSIGRGSASRHGDCQHHGGRGPAVRVRSTQVKC